MKIPILIVCLASTLFATPLIVESSEGEHVFDVDPCSETLASFYDRLESVGCEESVLTVHLPTVQPVRSWKKKAERRTGGSLGYPRDYQAGATAQDEQDVRFIVMTLADKSLISIAKDRYAIEAAGDRIDHLHPLVFLYTIFSDEQMKVGIRNMRGKGWVWSNFMAGLKETLNAEAAIDNLLCYVPDFAARVGVSQQLLMPFFEKRDWDGLVDTLIRNVPRKEDGNRYDM